jgi:hypothetical protein
MSLVIGSLVSVDWKAGVSLASSATKALNTPFVALQLTLRGADGKLVLKCVHLSLPEFHALLNGLTDAQKAMTRL